MIRKYAAVCPAFNTFVRVPFEIESDEALTPSQLQDIAYNFARKLFDDPDAWHCWYEQA